MARCAIATHTASVLILSLFVISAAHAAAEDLPAEKPTQAAASDDKSYLPPWMRPQPVIPAPGAPLREGVQVPLAQPAQTAEASDMKKAKSPSQGQSQRRRRHDWPGGFFGGVTSFFGR